MRKQVTVKSVCISMKTKRFNPGFLYSRTDIFAGMPQCIQALKNRNREIKES